MRSYPIFKRILIFTGLMFLGISIFFYVLLRFFHFSSSSAALYLLRDSGGLRITNDISFYEIDSLVFKIDLTNIFNRIFETSALATDTPLIDASFNTSTGRGVIKEFRPDGSIIEIALSRFDDVDVKPRGLIIGGDFPPGDSGLKREASGIAFNDGKRWYHLWCNANEGIALSGGNVYDTTKWIYLEGKIIKRDFREFIAESLHSVDLDGYSVLIKRRLETVAGRNYIDLTIDIKNLSDRVLMIDYAYGDEPWVGEYGTSKGDVGWYPGGLIMNETYIDPLKYNIAGFWDTGNTLAGETGHFTGLANYIQWLGKPPTLVYFSNDFYSVDPQKPLSSPDSRLLNIVWKGIVLAPGEVERLYLRIGFSAEPVSEPSQLARLIK